MLGRVVETRRLGRAVGEVAGRGLRVRGRPGRETNTGRAERREGE